MSPSLVVQSKRSLSFLIVSPRAPRRARLLVRRNEMSKANAIVVDSNLNISLSDDELDVADAVRFVCTGKCGAISVFIGTTRDTEKDASSNQMRAIESLFYEAYADMALSVMRAIATKALREDNIERCYVAHRTGTVLVAAPSIIVACSSLHRSEAQVAVSKILNSVKAEVPIWKRPCSDHGHLGNWSDKSEAFWLAKQSH